jgi:hypothetical protein
MRRLDRPTTLIPFYEFRWVCMAIDRKMDQTRWFIFGKTIMTALSPQLSCLT